MTNTSSYKVTAYFGSTLLAEDVLIPTSCRQPSFARSNSLKRWTSNASYAAVAMVPLKVGLLDAFRQNAEHVGEESVVANQIKAFESEVKRNDQAVKELDVSVMRKYLKESGNSNSNSIRAPDGLM